MDRVYDRLYFPGQALLLLTCYRPALIDTQHAASVLCSETGGAAEWTGTIIPSVGVRFTWSDVKLWTELDRLLQLDSEDQVEDCCDPSPHGPPGSSSRASANSSWTDVWRVYEDVCVCVRGCGWAVARKPCVSVRVRGSSRRMENWGSIRLDGEDNLALRARSNPYVRSVGLGIEGADLPDSTAASAWTRAARHASVK
ncbi:hypothetical protein A0H81_07218 [Grifola frondosa]|uniref:Uncharacterized protein n=1 Tax=Grifola frondosa TaxID=5627 RepID=A0A1C7M9V4_GRIFR|nr:hypothetical protein A0H81_07218 [Grifola frondosa]